MAGELFILFNTAMNILLLKFTVAVTGFHVRNSRLWLSACCSTMILVLLPTSFWTASASFLCLLFIAFSWRVSTLLIQGSWLLVGTLLVGGFLTMLQPLFMRQGLVITLVVCSLLAASLLAITWRGWQHALLNSLQQAYVTACELMIDEERLTVRAYLDTGNECREPLSAAPVHFLAFEQVKEQLSESFCCGLARWQSAEPTNLTMFPASIKPLIRFVQVRTIQSEPQLVLAFRTSQLAVDDRNYTGHYVVFTQQQTPFPQQAEMILHVCILLTK